MMASETGLGGAAVTPALGPSSSLFLMEMLLPNSFPWVIPSPELPRSRIRPAQAAPEPLSGAFHGAPFSRCSAGRG